jgi:two-component sensor histidine kinase
MLRRKGDYPDELSLLIRSINLMRNNLNEHLHERELRIAEMHHRIKNDLGFVYSMLYLQADQSKSEEASRLINDAGRRISVVTRIYERLYTEKNFLEVAIKPLLVQIINDLKELGVITADTLTLRIEEMMVPTKVSISIGIILNELITNGVKYAGEGKLSPRLDIAVSLLEDGKHVSITVKDDGAGFPSSVIEEREFGFGLTVIHALVTQHQGSLNLKNDHGAVVSVTLEF